MIQFEAVEEIPKKQDDPPKVSPARIKVVGVGGAGCNIVSRIYSESWSNINFTICDSSAKTLFGCENVEKMLLGESITRGWGTGGDKEIARRVAQEAEDKIRSILNSVDLLFVVCGLGKGLGAEVSPLILKIAREAGILSIGFFILPFSFEGKETIAGSREALSSLWQLVDGAVIVSNDMLLRIEEANSEDSPLSLREVFTKIDEVLEILLQSVHNIIYHPGIIGIDFADIKSFLIRGKQLIINEAEGSGERCVEEAVENVFYSPFWGEISFNKAKSVLLIIRAGEKFKLSQLRKIIISLRKKGSSSIPITFGVYTQEDLSDRLVLTLMTSNTEALGLEPGESERSYQQELGLEAYDERNLDVPTFLRKQHN